MSGPTVSAWLSWEPSLRPVLLAIVGAVAAGFVVWSYLRLRGHLLTATGYLMLRLTILGMVVGALAGPVAVTPGNRRYGRKVLVLVDASSSMTKDHQRILERIGSGLKENGIEYGTVYFARDVAGAPGDVDDSATNLALPLTIAGTEMPKATVLVSDGRLNAGGNALLAWKPSAGKVLAVFPKRRPPLFRLNPAPGYKEKDDVPGLVLPRQAASGRPFKVVVRVLPSTEAGIGRGEGMLEVCLRGPINGPDLEALETLAQEETRIGGGTTEADVSRSAKREEFSFTATGAGHYLVEAKVTWTDGEDAARGILVVMPGPLNAVYLDGRMSWRVGLMRSAAKSAGDEIHMSVFRLYAKDAGIEQALAGAETLVLGAFPESDLPVPLRVGLESALRGGIGVVFLWDEDARRWLDALSLGGPVRRAGGEGEGTSARRERFEGKVRLSGKAAAGLGIAPFEFEPVWMEKWEFGGGFEAWFTGGPEGLSPCWAAEAKGPQASPVFLQDAVLKGLFSEPAGAEFLSAALYRAAGRARSASELRLSLSSTLIPPGGFVEISAEGKALSREGTLSLSCGRAGAMREVYRSDTGSTKSHSHTVQLEDTGIYFVKALHSGVDGESEAWAACVVAGRGVEDCLLAPDVSLLTALAEHSGGVAVSEEEAVAALPEFMRDLPEPEQSPESKEPWRRWWLLWATMLAALFVEWALRTR